MHAPLRLSAYIKGAVLLHVLLLLLVVAGLIMVTLSTAKSNILQAAALDEKTRLEMRVEAGVEMIVQDIIEHGQRSRWLTSPGYRAQFPIDGIELKASVSDTRGLVDINFSDLELLEPLLQSRLGDVPAQRALERLRENRSRAVGRWGTYVDMSAALEMSSEQVACLQPHITLFSMLDRPDSRYASDALKELLQLRGPEEKGSVISEEHVGDGQTYKIIVSSSGSLIHSANLVVELVLTGKIDQPYVLRSWIWGPQTSSASACRTAGAARNRKERPGR